VTHTLTLAWTRNGETLSKSVNVSVEGEQNVDVTVPGSTNDVEVVLDLDVSALKSVFVQASETVTLETNSAGSPAETITITKDKPLVWYEGCGWANPFATDVTAVFLSRGSAGNATVNLRFGYDATP
jgi:hypothetical protein